MTSMSGFRKEEEFELPVVFDGQELILPGKFVQMGYTYKIFVEVNGQEIIFEPDEERNFRTVMENQQNSKVPVALVKIIGEALEFHFR